MVHRAPVSVVLLSAWLFACARPTPSAIPSATARTETHAAVLTPAVRLGSTSHAADHHAHADRDAATLRPTSHAADHRARAERDAAEVFRAMHGDLLGCAATRLTKKPDAHAFITVDVLVGPDGDVREVTTTGGAQLGARVMKCIERRVARAVFVPHVDGGTSRVRVPLELVVETNAATF